MSHHVVSCRPEHCHWGFFDAALKPIVTIQSGDTVQIDCVSGGPDILPKGDNWEILDDHLAIHAGLAQGPGGHILTGPVAIEGAEPGDVLEVRIQKINIDVPWACNGFGPGRGFLPNDFPYGHTRIIPLDRDKMIGHFAPGIDIPLHPFFGSMGIAPPEGAGKYNSAPPWMHAGNIDNKEMVAGTTLSIPINSKGAN